MPFTCAKAVCATFCASIAGALIPLFGPDFPKQCVPLEAPEYGRMVIDQMIVAEGTREAEVYRRMYANANSVNENSQIGHHHYNPYHHHQSQSHHHYYNHGAALPSPSPTSVPSPHLGRQALTRYNSPLGYEQDHAMYDGISRLRKGPDSPYGTASEPEMFTDGPDAPSSLHHHHTPQSSRGKFFPSLSPPRSTCWTAVNDNNKGSSNSALSGNNNNNNNNTGGNSKYGQRIPSAGLYHHGPYHEEAGSSSPYSSSANPLLSAIPRFGEQHISSSPTFVNTNVQQHTRNYSCHHNQLPPLSLGPATTNIAATTATATPTSTASSPYTNAFKVTNSTAWSHATSPSTNNNQMASKRPALDILDDVADYEDYDNHSGSSPSTIATTADMQEDHHHHQKQQQSVGTSANHHVFGNNNNNNGNATGFENRSVAEKSAALLLMQLSVKDNRSERGGSSSTTSSSSGSGSGGTKQFRFPRGGGAGCGTESTCVSPVVGAVDGHRSKRRRATSM